MKMLLLTYKSNRESGSCWKHGNRIIRFQEWEPHVYLSISAVIKGAAGVNEGAFSLIKRHLYDGEKKP
jgi:hypothetical protein